MASETNFAFSNTEPAAPAGMDLVLVQSGGADPALISYSANATGGVNPQVGTSYTLLASDRGYLITTTNAAAIAVTLPVTLQVKFTCAIQNLGAGTATLTPTTGTINGFSSVPLTTGEGASLYFDGTNWEAVLGGSGSASPLTTKGDLYTHSTVDTRLGVGADGTVLTADSTQTDGIKWATPASGFTAGGDLSGSSTTQEVIGIANTAIDIGGGLPDGTVLQKNNTTGKWEPILIPVRLASSVPGKPAAGQEALIFVVDLPIIFPANFTGSTGGFGPNGAHPAASATYVIYRNSTQIGTVVISTAGAFTFATTSGAQQTANTGDVISAIAPGTQDASMASVTMTFMAFRGSSVPTTVSAPPVFSWQGVYSGSTAYSTYNLVGFGTPQSVYICISPVTGGTGPGVDTAHWSLFSAAGATGTNGTNGINGTNGTNGTNGQVLYTDLQNETAVYAADTGSANTYAVALSPALTSYAAGQKVVFKIATANTGASTLNINSLGAKSLVKGGSTALITGDLVVGQIVNAIYDGTNFQLQGVSSSGGGDLTAKYIIGATDSALTNARIWPGLYNHVDAPPVTAGSLDDEFDASSFNLSRWTWVNQSTATVIQANSWMGLACPTMTGFNIHALVQTAPTSVAWQVTAKVSCLSFAVNYQHTGLIVYDGTKLLGWSLGQPGPLQYVRGNTTTSYSTETDYPWYVGGGIPVYLQIKNDLTNYYFSVSVDGVNFVLVRTEAVGAFIATTGLKVGLFVDQESGTYPVALGCDWFRRTL